MFICSYHHKCHSFVLWTVASDTAKPFLEWSPHRAFLCNKRESRFPAWQTTSDVPIHTMRTRQKITSSCHFLPKSDVLRMPESLRRNIQHATPAKSVVFMQRLRNLQAEQQAWPLINKKSNCLFVDRSGKNVTCLISSILTSCRITG